MIYTPPEYVKLPPPSVRRQCRLIVLRKAALYNVPPVHVTSHAGSRRAHVARVDAMKEMLALGLTRGQLALAFQRHKRRVRKSVLGV